jgi:hypothetical protein
MRIRKLVAGIASLAGLCIVIASHSAQANSYTGPAFPGAPSSAADASCWSNGNGALTQTCTGTHRICMPLVYSPAVGNATVGITGDGINSSETVTCFAQAVTRAGAVDSWSGYATLPSFGAPVAVPTLTTYLSSGDSLYACCDVGQHATVESVWWNTP